SLRPGSHAARVPRSAPLRHLRSFPTRRSSDLWPSVAAMLAAFAVALVIWTLMGLLITKQKIPAFIITLGGLLVFRGAHWLIIQRSEEHTSELQSRENLVCRLLLEKKKRTRAYS